MADNTIAAACALNVATATVCQQRQVTCTITNTDNGGGQSLKVDNVVPIAVVANGASAAKAGTSPTVLGSATFPGPTLLAPGDSTTAIFSVLASSPAASSPGVGPASQDYDVAAYVYGTWIGASAADRVVLASSDTLTVNATVLPG